MDNPSFLSAHSDPAHSSDMDPNLVDSSSVDSSSNSSPSSLSPTDSSNTASPTSHSVDGDPLKNSSNTHNNVAIEHTSDTNVSTARVPLSDLMDPSWAQALQPVEPRIRELGNFLREEVQSGHPFLPHSSRIFAAFQIPVDQVKVLIVGQDPYPTKGHPIGLAFATEASVRPLPASLRNIYKELESDLHIPQPSHGDLTPWVKQGVMLLNRCLSVEVGRPGSHRNKGWEIITDEVIRILNNRTDKEGKPLPLVAILWGRDARNLAPLLTHATLIESPHPSPLSAYSGFFGSRPFSRANAALIEQGLSPINWEIK